MEDFDEDPLDLLGDDGDGVNETCLLLDEDNEKEQTGSKPPGSSGCCVTFLALGTSAGMVVWGISQIWT